MKICNNCTKVHSDNAGICDVCGCMSFASHDTVVKNQVKEVKEEKKGLFVKKEKKDEKRKK